MNDSFGQEVRTGIPDILFSTDYLQLAYAMNEIHNLRQQNLRIAETQHEALAEVENLQAEVSDLERYRKAHICTESCEPNQHVAFVGRTLNADLQQENKKLQHENALLKTLLGESEAEVENLRAEVSDLEYDAEVHVCEADHDDCLAQEDFDSLAEECDRAYAVTERLKDKHEELYWERSRVTGAHYADLTGKMQLLDEILEN